MRRCAFLSTDNLEDFFIYDELTYPHFAELGWAVDAVPWRASVDWSQYELVVVRSPWDYQQEPERFLEVLADIDRQTLLMNGLDVIRWNVRKDYLKDLRDRGVVIVPTLFRGAGAPLEVGFFEALGTEKIVVKPQVSANADDTHVLDAARLAAERSHLDAVFGARPYLVQPFMPAVVDEGEFSLFFFGGEYSHTVQKTPKSGDFRVQEEHGGHIRGVEPPPGTVDIAGRVIRAVGHGLLYARVDLIRDAAAPEAERWRLMEIELIEPSLYFSYGEGSAEHFTRATIAAAAAAR
ncbi:MAG: hypothetical protein AAGM22_25730 [Acidobacteriota bacterium]